MMASGPFSRMPYWFVVAALFASSLIWLPPYPPMLDLPQHAGQVELLKQFWNGQSPWLPMLQLNLFTPYLLGDILALTLSVAMPVVWALKLVLTLAFFLFLLACRLLQDEFGSDQRLKWVFIPAFFSLSYDLGFYPFMLALPIGLFLVLLALRYSRQPSLANGIKLLGIGILLFFTHGLVFLMACAIGGTLLLVTPALRFREKTAAAWPYLMFGILMIAYRLHVHHSAMPQPGYHPLFTWEWSYDRLSFLRVFWVSDSRMALLSSVIPVLLVLPRYIGSRLHRNDPTPFIPLAVLLLAYGILPSQVQEVSLIYVRFSAYFLPFFAFIFRKPDNDFQPNKAPYPGWFFLLIPGLSLFIVGIKMFQTASFYRESLAFRPLLEKTAPNQRALSLIFDAGSRYIATPMVYLHYPLWYQVEKGGFVDVNFASNPPCVVHFKKDQAPSAVLGYEFIPGTFDWIKWQGWRYRYFFVRRFSPISSHFFDNPQCRVSLVQSSGPWSLYESSCNSPGKTE